MEAAVEQLFARNRADITLSTGTVVTGQLPELREFVVSDMLPTPIAEELVTRELAKPARNGKVKPVEQYRLFRDNIVSQRVAVAMFVKAINGETVAMTPEKTACFTQAEFTELVEYADRRKPLPGKE